MINVIIPGKENVALQQTAYAGVYRLFSFRIIPDASRSWRNVWALCANLRGFAEFTFKKSFRISIPYCYHSFTLRPACRHGRNQAEPGAVGSIEFTSRVEGNTESTGLFQ